MHVRCVCVYFDYDQMHIHVLVKWFFDQMTSKINLPFKKLISNC